MPFPSPPRGIRAIPWRLPIYIYRIGLGWILGNRFLLLRHIGRISGELRFAVLEVVYHRRGTDTYCVVSGFGTRSDWYQNILKHKVAEIQIGRKRIPVQAQQLGTSEAGEILLCYAQENPGSFKALSRIMGYDVEFSTAGILEFGRKIPVIQFSPANQ
jgi:deazaflavin-dependent oxidoreductase (nitroreductase family)